MIMHRIFSMAIELQGASSSAMELTEDSNEKTQSMTVSMS
jgi:hypothetical protein